MYIAKIEIDNFRNFKHTVIDFNDGINVIIGANNTGKTNLVKALSLPFEISGTKRLGINDFNKNITLEELKKKSPKISIGITIKKGTDEEVDDLVTVADWLIKLEDCYEALLTYEFFLPEKYEDSYIKAVTENISDNDPKAIEKIWNVIRDDFLRLFVFKIWGGKKENQIIADPESIHKFDFQFLSAIRDVERDMFSGRNTLLREVLEFFLDYEIKIAPEVEKTKEEKENEIKGKKHNFTEKADNLISDLQERMREGKKQILAYAKDTGASFNQATPNFEGSISEVEIFSTLNLIVEYETGIKIPVTHNGLGYNNLIFMSLLLAKMQVNSDGDYLGSNAKIFSTMIIEEPEAHLHPSMQYKFLKFLKENKGKKKVRQIFVSTHSTHITSAISLEEIICLNVNNGITKVGYPGKVFPNEQSKKYVQRFLDATKSDMLFAQRVILVEGLAEQLLLSIFAKYIGKSLEDNHVAVINVGGRYFDHFLHLFDSQKDDTIHKKVACITDHDPQRKLKENTKYTSCYPFQYNQNQEIYDYQDNSTFNVEKYKVHPNIRFFSQDPIQGKTFEYDLILYNPELELLIGESMSNREEIKELMQFFKDDATVEKLLEKLPEGTATSPNKKNEEIKKAIDECDWEALDKKRAIIASRYLNSISKGEHALELAYVLESNLNKQGEDEYKDFYVPDYIKEAVEWICL